MPLELSALAPGELSPAVSRATAATLPVPARMMAAQGLAPLAPADLVTAVYQLTHDPDARVAEAAQRSAAALPDKILGAALDGALDPRVIEFFATRVGDRPALLEAILLNNHTSDETFVGFAGRLTDQPLEMLANNQQRLLRHPPIIEALYFNRAARMSTVDRVLELAVRNGLDLTGIPQFKDLAAVILGQAAPSGDGSTDPDDASKAKHMDDLFASLIGSGEDEERVDGTALEYDSPPEDTALSENIAQLPVSHKIRLALLGQAGDRALLIRDSNKLVAMSVIRSPKLTDQEIAKFAGNRSICEDVIRYIAERREWQKHYQVKVSLVTNPKCPLTHAMRLLPLLRGNDLRAVARSKNIPSALAQAAKRLARR